PVAHAIQQIRVNGGFSFGDNPQAAFVRNNFTWSDDVSWVKGKHDFRFGGILERSRVDLNNLFFQPAEFSFCNPAPGAGQTASQVVFNNFLAGKLCDYSGNLAFPLIGLAPASRILHRAWVLRMTFSVMARPASVAEPAFSTIAASLASSTTVLWIRRPSVLSSFSVLASSTPER